MDQLRDQPDSILERPGKGKEYKYNVSVLMRGQSSSKKGGRTSPPCRGGMRPCVDADKSLKIRGVTHCSRIKDDAEEIMRIKLYRGNQCGIEIAAPSRNSGTPRNESKGISLIQSLRVKRSNLLSWTTNDKECEVRSC